MHTRTLSNLHGLIRASQRMAVGGSKFGGVVVECGSVCFDLVSGAPTARESSDRNYKLRVGFSCARCALAHRIMRRARAINYHNS